MQNKAVKLKAILWHIEKGNIGRISISLSGCAHEGMSRCRLGCKHQRGVGEALRWETGS